LADISTVKEGDDVCTLGNPEGMTWILTKGSISGVRFGDYGFSAQTGCNRLLADITSTHGNSGGAVCNKRGEVVGLITQGSDKFPRQSACVSCFAVEQMLSVYFANKE
jgi:S1-C subfamily serine protease